ncbi:MAG: PQQ-dependent sugar dehydrogenase [Caldilineaceae bacterium]
MNHATRTLFVLSLLCIAALGCTPIQRETEQETFTMQVLTTGLSHPWEIAFGPDGYLWVTERTGKQVTRVNPTDGTKAVALTIPDAYQQTIHDGVLGMVLHPGLLQGTNTDYIYVAYTYDAAEGSTVDRRATIERYTYDPASETLGEPVAILTGLPASSDHNAGRLVFGPDEKLYYAIGDQGNNQLGNYCEPILAQVLPTAAEIEAGDWSHYVGKVLRINLDGTIPADNPTLEGVQSHVFTYGHRNIQGLAISAAGQLYASEHGPKTDDEVNLLVAGNNYGWPYVAGYQDDQAYVYANWSAVPACERLTYSDYAIPPSIPQQAESDWRNPNFTPPLYTFGTVPDDYDFQIAECEPNYYICWPTVAPTGMEIYLAQEDGIPGWTSSLLVTALKTGTVYRLALDAEGNSISGEAEPYFATTNRYRDLAISPDGRTFYVITDNDNNTQDPSGLPTNALENPGSILVFTDHGND